MAVWQFGVELVPNEWAEEHRTNLADYINCRRCIGAWKEPVQKEAAERVIDKYMYRECFFSQYTHEWGFIHWGDRHGFICWGDTEKSDITLRFENENITNIYVRIDLSGGYYKKWLKDTSKKISITTEEKRKELEETFKIIASISKELGLSIVAVEESEILSPFTEDFMSFLRRSRTVERMRSFPTDVTLRKAEQRLISELLRLAEGRETGDTAVIEPLPTQQELATLLLSQREAIGRDMSKLKDAGLIERKGRSLLIKSLSRMRTRLEGT